ncbi:hypothetical protein EYF80_009871 [Liparis tanakae]|uniref:Uncharacterized protein n=1 Tax=Liparis tanakae TaxID=230148 RepID=A0A4Z2IQN5_9TELE|nr:hypothetical protein EYF80_009871 [Liparis tanakae]
MPSSSVLPSFSRSPSSFFSMSSSPSLSAPVQSPSARRRAWLTTLNLLLYWASRGWAAAVLLGSLDTAKLAERARVRSSMAALLK